MYFIVILCHSRCFALSTVSMHLEFQESSSFSWFHSIHSIKYSVCFQAEYLPWEAALAPKHSDCITRKFLPHNRDKAVSVWLLICTTAKFFSEVRVPMNTVVLQNILQFQLQGWGVAKWLSTCLAQGRPWLLSSTLKKIKVDVLHDSHKHPVLGKILNMSQAILWKIFECENITVWYLSDVSYCIDWLARLLPDPVTTFEAVIQIYEHLM